MAIRIAGFALTLCCALLFHGHADGNNLPWDEYERFVSTRQAVTALSPDDLFGDRIDLYSGALSFSVTDVSVPGTGLVPMAVGRKLSVLNRKDNPATALPFADWELDIPNLSGVFATTWHDARCVAPEINQAQPPTVYAGGVPIYAERYWSGYQADMPGGGEMLLAYTTTPKPSAGGPYYWLTSERTYFSCLEGIRNGPGQGFLAIDSNGMRYRFDHMAQYYETPYTEIQNPGLSGTTQRRKNVLYATHIEDRFGNWVKYTYENNYNQPMKIRRIDAKDGRSLVFVYQAYGSQSYISSVTDGTFTWSYRYAPDTAISGRYSLSQAILPDTTKWQIAFAPLSRALVEYRATDSRTCLQGDSVSSGDYTGTVTHPSGAVGTFTVSPTRLGRNHVPLVCANYTPPQTPPRPNDPNDDYMIVPVKWDALALSRRQVSGPGVATGVWTYAYSNSNSWHYPDGQDFPICQESTCLDALCSNDGCAGSRPVTVTSPEGRWTRYTFGNTYRYNEGKLRRVETGSSESNILQTTSHRYNLAQSGQSFAARIGVSPQPRGNGFTSEYPRPRQQTTITRQQTEFVSQVNGYDHFARPVGMTRSGSLGNSRAEATAYHDDLARWVIGQTASVTCVAATPASTSCNGDDVVSKTDYDANAMPWKTWSFGKLQHTLGYHADGTLNTVTDGRNYTTTLSSWYRGVPRDIRYPATQESPDGATQSAIVRSNGWIESVADENGYRTCYTYNPMGLVASVTHPLESNPAVCDAQQVHWNRTNSTFTATGDAVYGLPASHWVHVTETGSGKTVRHMDALWRPVVEEVYDASQENATRGLTVKRYDAAGRLVFQSYPMRTLGNYADQNLAGTHTDYDALDRITAVRQDSELGTLRTDTTYLSGFRRQTRNPNGHLTTESFQAWDVPSHEAPVRIESPEGVSTSITRDPFGKPTQVARSGPDG